MNTILLYPKTKDYQRLRPGVIVITEGVDNMFHVEEWNGTELVDDNPKNNLTDAVNNALNRFCIY